VNLNAAPPIAAALAAERHGWFQAEAQQARRLIELDRGRGRESTAAQFVKAVRVKAMAGAAQVESWGARRRLHQSSRLGQA
jgi:hypothetical protein